MNTPTNFNNPNPQYYGSSDNDPQKRALTLAGIFIACLLLGVIWLVFFRSCDKNVESLTETQHTFDVVKDGIKIEIENVLSIRRINSILVADYLNLENKQDKFGKYLAEDFSALFTRGFNSFRVIERSSLNLLIEEQNLNAAGLLDQETVSKLGKIIGVQAVITGKYQIVGNYLKLWIKVIDIEKSELIMTKEARILIEGELQDAIKIDLL